MTGRAQRLHDAQERLHQVDSQIDDLRLDRELVRREIELLTDRPGLRGSRTDRIVEILRQLRTATPKQVAEQLRLEEPGIDAATVRATLIYLLKEGRVCRPRRGFYQLPGS